MYLRTGFGRIAALLEGWAGRGGQCGVALHLHGGSSSAGCTGFFSRIKLPEIEHSVEVDEAGNKVGLWSHRLFIFGLIALFAYEVGEISINSFFINYVVEQNWMNAREASVVLSFGGLGLFMLGRFAGSWIMGRVRAEKNVVGVCYGDSSDYFVGTAECRDDIACCSVVRICV